MNVFLFCMACIVFLLPSSVLADSISCDGGIVSSGDSSVQLIIKCGQPQWKDSRTEEIVDKPGKETRRKTYITEEDWTYNLGENQFLRIVTIRNGVITSIRSGQRGTAKDQAPPGPACDDRVISVGDSKVDILVKCGEPFAKNSHQEEFRERISDSESRTIIVTVEEWTYNFGPQRFMRVITMRNGTVVDIRTTDYGR